MLSGKICFIFTALILSCSVLLLAEALESRYIDAKGGLRMRDTAGLSGKKIGLIPNGSEVQIITEMNEELTIAKRKGKWTQIRWRDSKGWVFGGFLSTEQKNRSLYFSDKAFVENLKGKRIGTMDLDRGGSNDLQDAMKDTCQDSWGLNLLDDGKIDIEEDVGMPTYGGIWKVKGDRLIIRIKGGTFEGLKEYYSTDLPNIIRRIDKAYNWSYYIKLCK